MSKLLLSLIPLCAGLVALLVSLEFSFDAVFLAVQNIAPLEWSGVFTAMFCGVLFGWERKRKNKVLGMRTSMFIVLGTYVFASVSSYISEQSGVSELGQVVSDPTRIIGQIVSGIGFLGAGVMFTKNDKVKGLTTAATIWVLAALGVCIGVGFQITAIIVASLGVTILMATDVIDTGVSNTLAAIKTALTNKAPENDKRPFDENA